VVSQYHQAILGHDLGVNSLRIMSQEFSGRRGGGQACPGSASACS
jgi:hypothetical protein